MVYVWTCASNKLLCLLTVGLHFSPYIRLSPHYRGYSLLTTHPALSLLKLPILFISNCALFISGVFSLLSTWIFIWGSLSIWSPLWCSINISSILSQDYFPWFSHCTLLKTFEPLNYWMNYSQSKTFWLQKFTLGNAFNYQEYFNAHIGSKTNEIYLGEITDMHVENFKLHCKTVK